MKEFFKNIINKTFHRYYVSHTVFEGNEKKRTYFMKEKNALDFANSLSRRSYHEANYLKNCSLVMSPSPVEVFKEGAWKMYNTQTNKLLAGYYTFGVKRGNERIY